MDFRQVSQPANPQSSTTATPGVTLPGRKPEKPEKDKSDRFKPDGNRLMQVLHVIILFGIAILIACIALAFTRSNKDNESQYLDSSKFQAVFLNNGAVYFGHVASLTGGYIRMTDIYYLVSQNGTNGNSSDSSANNLTLEKLGCQQIHDPFDEMIINRTQVSFWENLQNGGKVVSTIKQFQKQNPNGPDCSQTSDQTQAPASNTQGNTGDDSTTGNGSNTTGK